VDALEVIKLGRDILGGRWVVALTHGVNLAVQSGNVCRCSVNATRLSDTVDRSLRANSLRSSMTLSGDRKDMKHRGSSSRSLVQVAIAFTMELHRAFFNALKGIQRRLF
jgi:hypothetical protein